MSNNTSMLGAISCVCGTHWILPTMNLRRCSPSALDLGDFNEGQLELIHFESLTHDLLETNQADEICKWI